MAEVDRAISIILTRERGVVGIGQMMRVNNEFANPQIDKVIERVGDKWSLKKRDQRFRQSGSEGFESSSKSST